MRLIMDLQACQTSGSRFRGIGRYSNSLAKAMLRRAAGHDCWIALNGAFPESVEAVRAEFDSLLPADHIRVWEPAGAIAYADAAHTWRRLTAETLREFFLDGLQPDFVHVSSLFEGLGDNAVSSVGKATPAMPVAVTLYDLIPLVHQDVYLGNARVREWYYEKLDALRHAGLLLAISESSRREALDYLQLPESRVVNISSAADPMFRPLAVAPERAQALRRKMGLRQEFVMYTGGIDHRKNIEGLIRAFALLPLALRKGRQLAIVCKVHPDEQRRLASLAASVGLADDDLVMTGFVSDQELVELCNLCTLFVFPSWHEGFGLPALEAMACGAPVIASNTSSLPEVIGRQDALFDPRSDVRMAEKIAQALGDDAFRMTLSEHGKQQARRFSWDETARLALEAMEVAHDMRTRPVNGVSPGTVRPKLAFVSPLPPERTGIADYSAELLPALARHYDIEVVTDQQTVIPALASFRQRRVDWFRANARNFDRVVYQFGNSPFHEHMFDLLEQVPGVVVLHDFYLGHIQRHRDFSGSAPGAWGRSLYESHGYGALLARKADGNGGGVIDKYPANGDVLGNSTGVIVHSEYCRDLAGTWYGPESKPRITYVPQLRRFEAVDSAGRGQARRRLELPEDKFVVATFGLVTPGKLAQRIIEAWHRSALSRSGKCCLIFVGEVVDPAYAKVIRASLEGVGHQSVKMTGFVTAEQYQDYLALTDLGVQLRANTRGETSRAVLDCLASGIPVIVNAHGAAAELPRGTVEQLEDDFSDDELVAALERLWHDEGARRRLGAAAQAYVQEDLSPAHVAESYFQAIEHFESSSPRRRLDRVARGIADVTASIHLSDAQLHEVAGLAAGAVPARRFGRQLFVDVSELVTTDAKSGIQRVVRSVLRELLEHPPVGYRVEPVFTDGAGGYRYARRFTCQWLEVDALTMPDEAIEAAKGDVFLGLDLAAHLIPGMVDYFRQLRHQGVSVNFVLYDLLPALQPQWFPEDLAAHLQRWYAAIAQASDRVIAISGAVAHEYTQWLDIHQPERVEHLPVTHFHLGADIESSLPTRGIDAGTRKAIDSLGKGSPSFLMVGTVEPRKGHAQALAAFERLWNEGVNVSLVVVGKRGWRVDELCDRLRLHPENGRRLFWFEGVSDESLEAIYASASMLLAASYGEGFGLPLIEAAQRGLPLLARDLPVFREVAGDGALYFQASSETELADAVQQALAQLQAGNVPDPRTVQTLTWAQSTQELVDVLFEADSDACTWEPGRRRLFPAGHASLHSQLSELRDGAYSTEGVAGFLVYGPYVNLTAGHYRIRLLGHARAVSEARYDIVADQGALILAEDRLAHAMVGNGALLERDIVLEQDTEGVEVRLWVDNAADLRLHAVEILRLDEASAKTRTESALPKAAACTAVDST